MKFDSINSSAYPISEDIAPPIFEADECMIADPTPRETPRSLRYSKARVSDYPSIYLVSDERAMIFEADESLVTDPTPREAPRNGLKPKAREDKYRNDPSEDVV